MAAKTESNPLVQPPVVQNLFSFLPAKALCNAARVCKLWRSEAATCLRHRRQYSWQLFYKTNSFLDKLQHYFEEELSFRPSMVIVFMSTGMWKGLAACKRKRNRLYRHTNSRTAWRNFCNQFIPSRCQVFCSITSGVVATFPDCSRTIELEAEVGGCASVLCFGQYPGLKVSLLETAYRGRSEGAQEPDLEHTKVLLLMSSLVDGLVAMEHLHAPLPQPLIVGGVVSTTMVHNSSERSMPRHVDVNAVPHFVVFQGEDVQVACVKMDEQVTNEEKVEQVMKHLKDKTKSFPMDRSIAFMFACVARGFSVFKRYNVESSVFRRYFPTTPLLGLFGNGEIGCEYPIPEPEKSPQNMMDLINSYTTFIVVISLP